MPTPDKVDAALRHLRELPRAQPSEGLLARIEAGLQPVSVISLQQWRQFAAAAAVVVLLNVVGVVYYTQADGTDTTNEFALVTDYQLYD